MRPSLLQVKEYELEASSDYRFNYRLAKSCKDDIESLCSGVCRVEDGQVCYRQHTLVLLHYRCFLHRHCSLAPQLPLCTISAHKYPLLQMCLPFNRCRLIPAAPLTSDVQVCGGTVLRCLTEKRQEVKSEQCKAEIFYFEKMEVRLTELWA